MKTWCKKVVSALLLVGSFAAATARGALPTGYTELEYIQSTGVQYLDLGYCPNSKTKLVMDLKMSGDFSDRTVTTIASAVQGDYQFAFNFGGNANQSTTLFLWPYKTYGKGGDIKNFTFTESIVKGRNTLSFGQGTCSWGTSSTTMHANATDDEVTYTNTLKALGNASGNPFTGYAVTLYGIKIYEDDEVVRDYVPCVNSSGVAGVYETVQGTFHPNANEGGADFEKGYTETEVELDERLFDKKSTITISGYAGSTKLENFPVLVRIAEGSPAGFFYEDCADGSEIRFADADGNLIPHEIDTWDPTGTSYVWVRVPSISGTATTLTLYYKAVDASALPLVSARWVWSRADYNAVWHFSDSTSDSANGLKPSSTKGTIAYTTVADRGVGKSFYPTGSQCLSFANDATWATLGEGSTLSVSCWAKYDSSNASFARMVSAMSTWSNPAGWELTIQNAVNEITVGSTSSSQYQYTATEGPGTDMIYISAVYHANKNVDLFINGVKKKTAALNQVVTPTETLTIGAVSGGSQNLWNGKLDEIRIHATDESDDWVAASYATMASDTFLVPGIVEDVVHSTAVPNYSLSGATACDEDGAKQAFKVTGLGDGASSATLTVRYGLDPDAEIETSTLTVTAAELTAAEGELYVTNVMNRLKANCSYYATVACTNNLGVGAEKLKSFTFTTPEGETTPGAGRAFGAITFADDTFTVNFAADSAAGDLYALYGPLPGGSDPDGWAHVVKVGTIAAEATSATFPAPSGWGAENRSIAFAFLSEGGSVKGYYADDSLLACWDAAEGLSADGWADLVGDRTFDLTGVTVGANGVTFAGSASSYAILNAADTTAVFGAAQNGTIEIVCDFPDGKWIALMTPQSCSQTIGGSVGAVYLTNGAEEYFPTYTAGYAYSFAVVYAGMNAVSKAYFDGVESSRTYKNVHDYDGTQTAYLGKRNKSGNERPYTGTIRALRVYSAALSADAIAEHARIDGIRFLGQEGELPSIGASSWSTVYAWSDPAAVALADASETANTGTGENYGVAYTVSGSLSNLSGASEVTVDVVYGTSRSNLDQTSTATAVLTAAGEYAIQLTGLTADTTYYYQVRVKGATGVDRTGIASFATLGASSFTHTFVDVSKDGHSVTYTIKGVVRGAGVTKFQVHNAYGDNQHNNLQNVSYEKVITEDGDQTFTVTYEKKWGQHIYWALGVSNTAGGKTYTDYPWAVNDTSKIYWNKEYYLTDASTYTWMGTSGGAWNDAANWERSGATTDYAGYPVPGATAKIAGEDDLTITVPTGSANVIEGGMWQFGALNLNEYYGELTFSATTYSYSDRLYSGDWNYGNNHATIVFANCAMQSTSISDIGASSLNAEGGNYTMIFKAGSYGYFSNQFHFNKPGIRMRIEEGAKVYSSSGLMTGTGSSIDAIPTMEIAGGTFEQTGSDWINYGTGQSVKFVFSGTSPYMLISSLQSCNANRGTTYIDFIVPEGGYTRPPLRVSGNYRLNATDRSPLELSVNADSPALKAGAPLTTELVHALLLDDASSDKVVLASTPGVTWNRFVNANGQADRYTATLAPNGPGLDDVMIASAGGTYLSVTGRVTVGRAAALTTVTPYVKLHGASDYTALAGTTAGADDAFAVRVSGLAVGSEYDWFLVASSSAGAFTSAVETVVFDNLATVALATSGAEDELSPITVNGEKVYIFTNSTEASSFELTKGGPAEILVIGGGGAGGNAMGGGGGAGGYLYTSTVLPAGTYTITVGKGGYNANAGQGTTAVAAGDSTIVQCSPSPLTFTSLTAPAGGRGNCWGNVDRSGASGGGGNGNNWLYGTGLAGYGHDGGCNTVGGWIGSGGGGAGSTGGNAFTINSVTYGGAGGYGITNAITGVAVCYAAGGGGGTGNNDYVPGVGGGATAGNGGYHKTTTAPTAGQANTGSGGGGGAYNNDTTRKGGAGGSGIVVIRLKNADAGNTDPTIGGIFASETTPVSVTVGASVMLGDGASEATVRAVLKDGDTVLAEQNANITADGLVNFTFHNLATNTAYTVVYTAMNDTEGEATSTPFAFTTGTDDFGSDAETLTLAEQAFKDALYLARATRTLMIGTSARVYCCYGATYGGNDRTAWDNCLLAGVFDASASAVVVSVPSVAQTARYVRFFVVPLVEGVEDHTRESWTATQDLSKTASTGGPGAEDPYLGVPVVSQITKSSARIEANVKWMGAADATADVTAYVVCGTHTNTYASAGLAANAMVTLDFANLAPGSAYEAWLEATNTKAASCASGHLEFSTLEEPKGEQSELVTLPDGGTTLKYVRSTGAQWVDTGIVPGTDTAVEFRFGAVEYVNSTAFFGQSWSANCYLFNMQSDCFYWHGGSGAQVTSQKVRAMADYTFTTAVGGTVTLSNETSGATYALSGQPMNAGAQNLAIFGIAGGGNYGKFRFYAMKIWKGGELVRDFVPAKDANGVAALWDNVSDSYFYSETSTPLVAGEPEAGLERFKIGGWVNGTAQTSMSKKWLVQNNYFKAYTYATALSATATDASYWYRGWGSFVGGTTYKFYSRIDDGTELWIGDDHVFTSPASGFGTDPGVKTWTCPESGWYEVGYGIYDWSSSGITKKDGLHLLQYSTRDDATQANRNDSAIWSNFADAGDGSFLKTLYVRIASRQITLANVQYGATSLMSDATIVGSHDEGWTLKVFFSAAYGEETPALWDLGSVAWGTVAADLNQVNGFGATVPAGAKFARYALVDANGAVQAWSPTVALDWIDHAAEAPKGRPSLLTAPVVTGLDRHVFTATAYGYQCGTGYETAHLIAIALNTVSGVATTNDLGQVASGDIAADFTGMEKGVAYKVWFEATNDSGSDETPTTDVTTVGIHDLNLSDYTYRVRCTVTGASGAETFENFPVLVRIPSAIAAKCRADGSDIRFTLDGRDADDVEVLNHEIAAWDAAGTSLVWVTLPSSKNGTEFYLYYGLKDGGYEATVDADAVWTAEDTVYQAHAITKPATVEAATVKTWNLSEGYTFSACLTPHKNYNYMQNEAYFLNLGNKTIYSLGGSGNSRVYLNGNHVGDWWTDSTASTEPHYFTYVLATNKLSIYRDGNLQESRTIAKGSSFDTINATLILGGGGNSGASTFAGTIADVRFTLGTVSATRAYNMALAYNEADYVTLAGEQVLATGAPILGEMTVVATNRANVVIAGAYEAAGTNRDVVFTANVTDGASFSKDYALGTLADAGAYRFTLDGLSDGTSYTVTLTATTANGTLGGATQRQTTVSTLGSGIPTFDFGTVEFADEGTSDGMVWKQFPTGASTIEVTHAGKIDILLVGGGGASGRGGGAGGAVVYEQDVELAVGSYTITVGAGGAVVTPAQDKQGGSGGASVLASTSTPDFNSLSAAGGAGGYFWKSGTDYPSRAGGTSGNGNKGGAAYSNTYCGGGAGAGAVGADGTSTKAGDGGDGVMCDITGVEVYYGGGGGGAVDNPENLPIEDNAGQGGLGGGGRGQQYMMKLDAEPGVDGLGGGAGGIYGATCNSAGGAGTVIIRYAVETEATPVVRPTDVETTETEAAVYVEAKTYGAEASAADLYLAYGLEKGVYTVTNFYDDIQLGEGGYLVEDLIPDRTYYAVLWAVNDRDVSSVAQTFAFQTEALADAEADEAGEESIPGLWMVSSTTYNVVSDPFFDQSRVQAYGTFMADWNLLDHVNEADGETYKWYTSASSSYTGEPKTYGYKGYLYMVAGVSYQFAGGFDNGLFCSIDGTTVANSPNGLASVYVPTYTGWHLLSFRVYTSNQSHYARQFGQGYGLAFNTNGVTSCGSAADRTSWTNLSDPGDGSLLRTRPFLRSVKATALALDANVLSGALGFGMPYEADDAALSILFEDGTEIPLGTVTAAETAAAFADVDTTGHELFRFALSAGDLTSYSKTYAVSTLDGVLLDGEVEATEDGDSATVAADLLVAGDGATAKIVYGTSADALIEATTPVAVSAGAVELALANLAPETTYYYQVVVTDAAGKVDVSPIKSMTTLGGAEWTGLCTYERHGKTIRYHVYVNALGAGENKVRFIWNYNNQAGEANCDHAAEIVITEPGDHYIEVEHDKWGRYIRGQIILENTCAGQTWAKYLDANRTNLSTLNHYTEDNSTYTWVGGAAGDWNDEENWELTTLGSYLKAAGEARGLPTRGSTAVFPKGNGDTVVTLDAKSAEQTAIENDAYTGITTLNLDAVDYTLTFAADSAADNRRLWMENIWTGCTNGTIVVDGAYLNPNQHMYPGRNQSAGQTQNVTLRVTNGGKFWVGNQFHFYRDGVKIIVEKGSSMGSSGQSYMGGANTSLTIDDASFTFNSQVELNTARGVPAITVKGTNGCFTAGNFIKANSSTYPTLPITLEIPEDGFRTIPVRQTSAQRFPYDANTKFSLTVSPDSPALQGYNGTNVICRARLRDGFEGITLGETAGVTLTALDADGELYYGYTASWTGALGARPDTSDTSDTVVKATAAGYDARKFVGKDVVYVFTNRTEAKSVTVTQAGHAEILVVGGGGGGGCCAGGGGGGGGVVYRKVLLPVGTYEISVGAGGGINTSRDRNGYDGEESSFVQCSPSPSPSPLTFTSLTAAGGGAGNGWNCGNTDGNTGSTLAGASGGGAGGKCGSSMDLFRYGTGIDGQGHDGAFRYTEAGAGGGGAGELGHVAHLSAKTSGAGGEGFVCDITGTSEVYGSGGSGGAYSGYTAGAAGTNAGQGGAPGKTGANAPAGFGGGGGGAGATGDNNNVNAGKGGSGCVIVRLRISDASSTKPISTGDSATEIGDTTATIGWTVVSLSGAAEGELVVKYGHSPDDLRYTSAATTVTADGQSGTTVLSDLAPGATYFVSISVTAGGETGASVETLSFATTGGGTGGGGGAGKPGLYQAKKTCTSATSAWTDPSGWDIAADATADVTLGANAALTAKGTVWKSADGENSYQWADNTIFGYTGYMYFETGKTYYFSAMVDDNCYVWVDTTGSTGSARTWTQFLAQSGWNSWARSSTPVEVAADGWYPIYVTAGNGSGGAGPGTNGKLRYATSALAQADAGWTDLLDSGDASLLRTELGARGVTVSSATVGADSLTLSGHLTAAAEAGNLYFVCGDTLPAEADRADPAKWATSELIGEKSAEAQDFSCVHTFSTLPKFSAVIAVAALGNGLSNVIAFPEGAQPLITAGETSGLDGDRYTLTATVVSEGGAAQAGAYTVWYGTSADRLLFKQDTLSMTGLTPATTYYYSIVYTNAAGSASTEVKSFTTKGASAITQGNQPNCSRGGRRPQFYHDSIETIGAGETWVYLVTSTVTTVVANFVPAGEPWQVTSVGRVTSPADLIDVDWGTWFYYGFMISNSCAGVTWVSRTSGCRDFTAQDSSTYVWKTPSSDLQPSTSDLDWTNPENWSSSGGISDDRAGYPVTGSTVEFKAGEASVTFTNANKASELHIYENANVTWKGLSDDAALSVSFRNDGNVGNWAGKSFWNNTLTVDHLKWTTGSIDAQASYNRTMNIVNGSVVNFTGGFRWEGDAAKATNVLTIVDSVVSNHNWASYSGPGTVVTLDNSLWEVKGNLQPERIAGGTTRPAEPAKLILKGANPRIVLHAAFGRYDKPSDYDTAGAAETVIELYPEATWAAGPRITRKNDANWRAYNYFCYTRWPADWGTGYKKIDNNHCVTYYDGAAYTRVTFVVPKASTNARLPIVDWYWSASGVVSYVKQGEDPAGNPLIRFVESAWVPASGPAVEHLKSFYWVDQNKADVYSNRSKFDDPPLYPGRLNLRPITTGTLIQLR